MTDSQNKIALQRRLFDEIARRLPPRLRLADEISDLLGISADAAYRRLRGETVMDLAECALLCEHFGVSLDSVLGLPVTRPSDYSYTPLDVRRGNDYLLYMQSIAARLERLADSSGAEIMLSAVDVPFFHFMPHRELTLFKLFAWTNSVYGGGASASFENFVRTTTESSPALFEVYARIAAAYRRVPSREIWTESTVDTFLKLMRYNFELGLFADPRTVVTLLEQFGELLAEVERRAEAGHKDDAPFNLYLSEVDVENNFILLKNEESMGCILKLFTINSLYITDPRFCTETLGWLDQLSRRSTLVSVTSERTRRAFFAAQHEKVRALAGRAKSR